MPRLLRYLIALVLVVAFAGCATTPSVGSKKWHTERTSEIETAFENDEISKEAYLSLKNETDQTRVEYQESMRRQLRSRRYVSFPHHHYYPYRHHRPYHHH